MGSTPSSSPGPELMRKRNLDTMEKWFRRDLDSHFSRITPHKARDRARWILGIAQQTKDPTVLFYCGVLYERGYGVKKNAALALRHYKHAARRQIVRGMEKVAVFYHNGIGVERDPRRAIRWYSRAAKLGSLRSMKTLVFLYEHGIGGVTRDEAMADKWKARIKRATGEEYEDHSMKLKVALATHLPSSELGGGSHAAPPVPLATVIRTGTGSEGGDPRDGDFDLDPLPPPPAPSSSSSSTHHHRPLSHRPYLQRPLASSSISSPPSHQHGYPSSHNRHQHQRGRDRSRDRNEARGIGAGGHRPPPGISQSPLQPKRQRHHNRGDPRDSRDSRDRDRDRDRGGRGRGGPSRPRSQHSVSSPPLPQLVPKRSVPHSQSQSLRPPHTQDPVTGNGSATRSLKPRSIPRLADLGMGARHCFSSSVLERRGGLDSGSSSESLGNDDDEPSKRKKGWRNRLENVEKRNAMSFTAGHQDVRKREIERAKAAAAARRADRAAGGGVSPVSTISSDVSTLADVIVPPDRDRGMVQGQGYDPELGPYVSSDSEGVLSSGSSGGSSSEDLVNVFALSPSSDGLGGSPTAGKGRHLPRIGMPPRRLSRSPGPRHSPRSPDSDSLLQKSGSWTHGMKSPGSHRVSASVAALSPSTGQQFRFPLLGQAAKVLSRRCGMKERHASMPPGKFDRILLQKKIQEADAKNKGGEDSSSFHNAKRSRSSEGRAGSSTDMSLLDSNMQSLRRRSSPRDKIPDADLGEEETGKEILRARLETKERQLREERAQHVRTQDTLRRCQKESQNLKNRVRALQKELDGRIRELELANKKLMQLRGQRNRKRE